MALIDEFGLIYTQHVYGDGLATPDFSPTDLPTRTNPRALARQVQYGDHDSQLYPHVTGVDGSDYLTYAVGTAPADGVLDADAPRLIDQHHIPVPVKESLITISWISKFPLVNTGNMHTITDAGISQLRIAGVIP
jgi:hypothetical protein